MSGNGEMEVDDIAMLKKRIDGLHDANTKLQRLFEEAQRNLEITKRNLESRIAEQLVLQNACKVNEERYRTLIDNIPGVVYRCANDAAWTMLFISNHVSELSGYPASDFIENSVRTYSSIIHNDDLILVVDAVQTGLRNKRPYTIEYRIKHANGSIRWMYEKGQGVFDPGGEFLWLDGAIFDITDRVPDASHGRWRADSVSQD